MITVKKISYLLLLSTLSIANANDNYIYKYKDANGKMIYADRIPSNEKGEVIVFSSKNGSIKKVVEKELNNEDIVKRNEQLQNDKLVVENNTLQKKKDFSLLSTYSNSDEIENMKKYELDQIDQSIKNNIDNIVILKDKLAILENNKKQSPNNKVIQENYNSTLNNINSIQQTIESNKTMYSQREKKYNEDKIRYIEILKEMAQPQNKN